MFRLLLQQLQLGRGQQTPQKVMKMHTDTATKKDPDIVRF